MSRSPVICFLHAVTVRLSFVAAFLAPQAAELDRAEEFKQATEGLALCEQRLTEYNGAAQQLVAEKEVRRGFFWMPLPCLRSHLAFTAIFRAFSLACRFGSKSF